MEEGKEYLQAEAATSRKFRRDTLLGQNFAWPSQAILVAPHLRHKWIALYLLLFLLVLMSETRDLQTITIASSVIQIDK